jgi:hypothetical protein
LECGQFVVVKRVAIELPLHGAHAVA